MDQLNEKIREELHRLAAMGPHEREMELERRRLEREKANREHQRAVDNAAGAAKKNLADRAEKLKKSIPPDLNIKDTKAAIMLRLKIAGFEQPELFSEEQLSQKPQPEEPKSEMNFTAEGGLSWESTDKDKSFDLKVFLKFPKAKEWLYYDWKNNLKWDSSGRSLGNTIIHYQFGPNTELDGYTPKMVHDKIMSRAFTQYMPSVKEIHLCWPLRAHAGLHAEAADASAPNYRYIFPAVRDPQTGKTYSGDTHRDAARVAIGNPEVFARLEKELAGVTENTGFIDVDGKFITRDEAKIKYGFSTSGELIQLKNNSSLAMSSFRAQAKLKPPVSVEELAKKWKVSEKVINKALDKGEKVEYEHTKDKKTARTIASHHIEEDLNYYDKLEVMEKKANLIADAVANIDKYINDSLVDAYDSLIKLDAGSPAFVYAMTNLAKTVSRLINEGRLGMVSTWLIVPFLKMAWDAHKSGNPIPSINAIIDSEIRSPK